MMYQLSLCLEPQNDVNPNWFWAYNLYGSLMEKFPSEIADNLHSTGLSPLSQHVQTFVGSKEIRWTINIIGDCSEYFTELITETKELTLKNHSINLKVTQCHVTGKFSEVEFAQKYLSEGLYKRFFTLQTVTPCSFKSKNEYVIFPTAELVIKSAVQKWNAFSKDLIISDEEAILQLIDAVKITSYKLKSYRYHIKGVTIPSFHGEFVDLIRGITPVMTELYKLALYKLCGIDIENYCADGYLKRDKLSNNPDLLDVWITHIVAVFRIAFLVRAYEAKL